MLTDQISDLLFIHSPEARENLIVRRGVAGARARGGKHDDRHAGGDADADRVTAARSGMAGPGSYLVVTLHRPALVDGPLLADAVTALDEVAEDMPVVFPIHPRTEASMRRQRLSFRSPGMRVLEPLGYVEFLSLVQDSAGVLTDSGGMQEETTYLGIPCFTLRDNTERPITCELGTNVLLGLAPERIREVPELIAAGAGSGRRGAAWLGRRGR